MNTSPFTAQSLAASVVAVPPLARKADLTIDRQQNDRIIRHLQSGGITTLLYGGNANFYHVPLSEYGSLLQVLAELAGDDTCVIPAVGPAYGTMMDQARVLREFDFPTVMVLPQQGVATIAGVESGVRRFVEALGKPVVLYLKFDGYLDVPSVKRLFDQGLVSVIKYAVVRDEPAEDPYLRSLADAVDPSRIMSGIGEQPAIVHLRQFGLGGFTSGCVCVAPKLSMQMLRAIQSGDFDRAEQIRNAFRPLEDHRNEINPIRVLHEATRLCGIAETGPILPLLDNLEPSLHPGVEQAARALLALNESAT